MCRLFGICYGEDQQERVPTSFIAASLFANLTRKGPHAFGWFTSDGDNLWTQKHFGRADTAAATDIVLEGAIPDDMPDESKMKFFIGHTRWATTGDPANMKNNHPVSHSNITGVHNGKVYNFEDILGITGREDDESEVDSEAIFAAVNKWGPVKGLRRLKTDMVSVWTDLRALDTIWLARSENRPIVIGWTDRGNIIFASEEQALEALWPHVRFVRTSKVNAYRLLKIKGGEIRSRRTYVEETRRSGVGTTASTGQRAPGLAIPGARPAPAQVGFSDSDWQSTALDRLLILRDQHAKDRDDFMSDRQQDRARARGAAAFD